MQLLAADAVSKTLVEAVPPQLLPFVEQGPLAATSKKKKKKSRKGKGKEKAVDQDSEAGGGDGDETEDVGMDGLEDELLDPSALVARALGSTEGRRLGSEDEVKISGSGSTVVR